MSSKEILIEELTDIADAIRSKTGFDNLLTIDDMIEKLKGSVGNYVKQDYPNGSGQQITITLENPIDVSSSVVFVSVSTAFYDTSTTEIKTTGVFFDAFLDGSRPKGAIFPFPKYSSDTYYHKYLAITNTVVSSTTITITFGGNNSSEKFTLYALASTR